VFGDNFYGQLGINEPFALKPKALTLTNVKKISAARNFSVALNHAGEVFVWGFNHHAQLGVNQEIIRKPLKIESGCVDVEAGEGVVVLVFEDCVKIAGFKKFLEFCRVDVEQRPVQIVAGDSFVAFVDRFGEVWHLGGLFGETRNFFYMKTPEARFFKVENGFFPGRVKKLFGKYSYHVAIVDD
jgi:alpha-tubulin suppressor-like RCC1 family protein